MLSQGLVLLLNGFFTLNPRSDTANYRLGYQYSKNALDVVEKICFVEGVERTKENILFLSYNTCFKNIFIAKLKVMNFVLAIIILTFLIGKSSKYPHFPLKQ